MMMPIPMMTLPIFCDISLVLCRRSGEAFANTPPASGNHSRGDYTLTIQVSGARFQITKVTRVLHDASTQRQSRPDRCANTDLER
jgi:hypothetical protein